MTNLSATSQALFDAVLIHWEEYPVKEQQWRIACVLRSAADLVIPEDPNEAMYFTNEAIRLNRMGIRRKFLAIAAELEGPS